MNTSVVAERFQSLPNVFLIALRYFTAVYLIIVTAILFYGWWNGNTFWLFAIFAVMAPLGLVLTLVYRLSKRRVIRAKTFKLAQVLEAVAAYIDDPPRNLPSYDVELSDNTAFVWHDVLSPFLLAVTRMLIHAKFVIISEESGRGKEWSIDPSPNSPPAILARQTKSIARAMRNDDPVSAFEAVGELLALPRKFNHENAVSTMEFTTEDFVQTCQDIARFLLERNLLNADHLTQQLIINVRERAAPDATNLKWLALIAYWLGIRMTIMKSSVMFEPTRIWSGPSKILAMQLNAALDAFEGHDFADLSEIVYESFDWRTRVPRFIL